MNAGIILDNDLDNDKRVLREIKILSGAGFKVSVLCFGFTGKAYNDTHEFIVNRITISRRTKNILFFLFNFLPLYEWIWSARIRKFIDDYNIGILHVHDLYMSRAAFRGKTSAGKNIPLILDLHENFPYAVMTYNWTKGFLRSLFSRPWRWKLKEREYLNYADRIIVLSEDFSEDLRNRYSELKENRFAVLPNVPDLSEESFSLPETAKLPFDKTAPVIFYFGIVAERRGIFEALKVFEEIVNEDHQALLLVVGPVDKADRKRFNDAIQNTKTQGKVIYIPWIDLSELPGYLAICDICIAPFLKNPQHESGVANKIFDYMLGKKPVVASDCRPQQRIIQKYHCGLIYNSKSEFKRALITLLKDEDLRNKMGVNGYEAVIKYYSLPVTRKTLIDIYDSFMKTGNRQ